MLEIVIKRTICFSPMLLIATEKLLVLWISYWSILRNQLKLHRYHNYKRSCSYITKISLDISVVNFKFLVKLFWLYMKNSTFWNNATKLPKQTFSVTRLYWCVLFVFSGVLTKIEVWEQICKSTFVCDFKWFSIAFIGFCKMYNTISCVGFVKVISTL